MDEPKPPYHWGGQGAAVAFRRVMKRIINMDDSISPPSKDIPRKFFSSNKTSINKSIKPKSKNAENFVVALSANKKFGNNVKIPELRGLSMRKAMDTLSKRGIVFDISGSGKVIWQHPKPGTPVKAGTICKVGLN